MSEKRSKCAKRLDLSNVICSSVSGDGNEKIDEKDNEKVDFEISNERAEIEELRQKLIEKEKELEMYKNELNARNEEIYRLRDINESLRKKKFGFDSIKHSSDLINFYTGLPNVETFDWVLERTSGTAPSLHSRLSLHDHLLIVFMKLKLGLLNKDIALRFGLSVQTTSKIFRRWIKVVASKLKSLIVWPEKGIIRHNLPKCFKKKYRDAVCIIDCSEIFIQRPRNLTARAQTWSNYKHNNTTKYLIGISPAGAVMFLSAGWGGRVSDKQITMESGFVDKLGNGDCILADRGFNIKEEFAMKGAILKVPSFTKGKNQLSGLEVDTSRRLSNVRIHVERVIGRIKKFRLLQSIIPITQMDLMDDIMVTICCAVNLNQSVVS